MQNRCLPMMNMALAYGLGKWPWLLSLLSLSSHFVLALFGGHTLTVLRLHHTGLRNHCDLIPFFFVAGEQVRGRLNNIDRPNFKTHSD